MRLAKQYINPNLEWETFSIEDMLKLLKAPRANCVMDATKLKTKLLEYGYEVKDWKEALEETFHITAILSS